MNDEIFFDGIRYIPANVAATEAQLSRDYIARLCKQNKIQGRQIGKNWYVNFESLKSFILDQGNAKDRRRKMLTRERVKEYWENRNSSQPIAHEGKKIDAAPASVIPPETLETKPTFSTQLPSRNPSWLNESFAIKSKPVEDPQIDRLFKLERGSGMRAITREGQGFLEHASRIASAPAGFAHA